MSRAAAAAFVLLVALSLRPGTAPASLASSGEPALGGLVARPVWLEDAANLVKNPSFEEVDGSGRAGAWAGTGPDTFLPTTAAARSGRLSLRLQDSDTRGGTPLTSQNISLAPGWYSLRGWIKTEGVGGSRRLAGARILVSGHELGARTEIVRGTTDWTRVEVPAFPVAVQGEASVKLNAYQKPSGTMFFDDIEVRRLIPPVVEGFLLYPNYRGVLFEDRPQQIRVSVTAHPDAKTPLSDLSVRLSLLKEGTKETVASVEQTPSTSNFQMTLDAGAVPPGDYSLRLQALQRPSVALLLDYPRYRIVKRAARDREKLRTYVDEDNVLVLGGRRTFVLGLYDTTGYSSRTKAYERRISEIAQAPINMYINYWLGNAPRIALEALMETLQRHRIFYLHTAMTWYEDKPRWPGKQTCQGQTANALGQERFTACIAATLGEHPGLAGWYTVDEEPTGEVPRVFDQYKVLRQHDPDGVTFIAHDALRALPWWRDTADVMDAHKYPIFNIPEGEVSPLEKVTQATEAAQSAVERSRPVWTVIQYYQFGAKGHWPTYQELRTMSYMAIVAGAKGLFYWSYGAKGLQWVKDPARKAELWQRLVKLTGEIKALEPALLSPDAPEVLSAQAPAGHVRVLAKRVGDSRYVIAVNNTAKPVQGTFTLSQAAGTIEVVGEARNVTPGGSVGFADEFAPYATHVYRIGHAEGPRRARGHMGAQR